jgi:hypothetical protein
MGYINQPPDLNTIFGDIDRRLKKLETAYRFTIPIVTTNPAYPREGDMWINSTDDELCVYYNSIVNVIFAF